MSESAETARKKAQESGLRHVVVRPVTEAGQLLGSTGNRLGRGQGEASEHRRE